MSTEVKDEKGMKVAIQAIIELGFNTKLGSDDPNAHIHLKEPGCINILEKITC